MAYSKLPKGVQDYAVGFQSLNTAIANGVSVRDAWGAKHGLLGQPRANPWALWGVHNDILIPRSVGRYTVSTVGGATTLHGNVQGAALPSPPTSGSVYRVSAGRWLMPVYFLGDFWAKVTAEGDGTVERFATAYVAPSVISQRVLVRTYEMSGGSFAETDLDFTLSVWGSP